MADQPTVAGRSARCPPPARARACSPPGKPCFIADDRHGGEQHRRGPLRTPWRPLSPPCAQGSEKNVRNGRESGFPGSQGLGGGGQARMPATQSARDPACGRILKPSPATTRGQRSAAAPQRPAGCPFAACGDRDHRGQRGQSPPPASAGDSRSVAPRITLAGWLACLTPLACVKPALARLRNTSRGTALEQPRPCHRRQAPRPLRRHPHGRQGRTARAVTPWRRPRANCRAARIRPYSQPLGDLRSSMVWTPPPSA